jgi:hypothetical protein
MTSSGFATFYPQNSPKLAALCRTKLAQSREITALISRRTIFGLKARRKLAFLPADNRHPKIRPREALSRRFADVV